MLSKDFGLMPTLEFMIDGKPMSAKIRNLIIAGWTGRDAGYVEHHIAELQAIGVARPRTVPCFYRVGANLLTTASEIEVTGPDSSGEAEFVLVSLAEGLFVGLGSDHTDRKVEAYGVTVSKQMCPKPISKELWPFDLVGGHWDSLILRSWVTRAGETRLYQEGSVNRMLAPEDLISRYTGGATILPANSAMYCGTMPLLAPMGAADAFTLELEDLVRGRSLKHSYTCRELPYND